MDARGFGVNLGASKKRDESLSTWLRVEHELGKVKPFGLERSVVIVEDSRRSREEAEYEFSRNDKGQ